MDAAFLIARQTRLALVVVALFVAAREKKNL
jgi:hypothetical protein